MIHLTTGLPGAGKTLYTLNAVRDRAIKESRAVYYHGIELLKPELYEGWVHLDDPSKWYELPDGALVVHDECQTLYRTRSTGSAVPRYVSEYETHRHKGYDIYLITQAPTLVDSHIRRLIGEHRHLVRGTVPNTSNVHFWAQVNDNPHKTRRDSERSNFIFPSSIIGSYKSATIHTHKTRIPKALIFLVFAPFILGGFVYLVVGWLNDLRGKGNESEPVAVNQQQSGERPKRKESELTPLQEWASARSPRVPGLPHTAPMYDSVTEPVTAPVPSACVIWEGKGCRCYTQQATRMDVPTELCIQIAARGYFVDFEIDHRRERDDRRERDRDVDSVRLAESERLAGHVIPSGGTYSGVPPGR